MAVPHSQDTAMQRKALDLINQDSRLVSPQKKRALDDDGDDEGVDLIMPDSKTPKIQSPTFNKRL